MGSMTRRCGAWFVTAWLAAGCVSSEPPAGRASGCVSGAQVSCACTGGAEGAQVCLADGSSFGACACPDVSLDASLDDRDVGNDADRDASGDATSDALDDGPVADVEVDAGAFAVGAMGAPCSSPGLLACEGHATKQQLVCGPNLTWDGNGACAANTLCDSRLGPEQGTCAAIRCGSSAQAGDVYCSGLTRTLCGPDRVSSSVVETCTNQACSPAACIGVCAPNQNQCSGPFDLQTCDASGRWAVTSTCAGDALCSAATCVACPSGTKLCGGSACLDVATDALHCGACERSCQGGVCASGSCTPTVLMDDKTVPSWVVADGSNVYWSTKRHGVVGTNGAITALPGTVMRYPLPSGPAVALFSSTSVDVSTFAVDATQAFFIAPTSNGFTGSLLAVPLDGSAPATTLADIPGAPGQVVASGGDVYWSDYVSATGMGAVRKVPKGGGAPVTLASGPVRMRLARSSTADVYWWSQDSASSATLYGLASGAVTPSVVAPALPYVTSVAVDATHVYWASSGGGTGLGTVMRVALAGGTFETLATAIWYPQDPLVLDDRAVYWRDQAGGGGASAHAIFRAAITGGHPYALARAIEGGGGLAVDATNVYWSLVHDWDASPSGGSVRSVVK